MSLTGWVESVDRYASLLRGFSCRDGEGREIGPEEGFSAWTGLALSVRERRGTIYLIGNGASASMASHLSADLAKNCQLHTQVFSDLSLITSISNDMGYEWVFAEPLRRRAHARDMLVAISSSGRSTNVLKAVEVAGEMELAVVTVSAMEGENPLRSRGSLNAYVAARTYGEAESCHAMILHRWMDMVQAAVTRADLVEPAPVGAPA